MASSPIHSFFGTHYILCVDLEATCSDDGSIERHEMEIIEFGCTVLDLEMNVVAKFNRFVRPIIHPQLTDFCKSLTTITQEQVDSADDWVTVASEIDDFVKQLDAPAIWVSWGGFDERLIARSCKMKPIPNPMPRMYFDLKRLEAASRNTKKCLSMRNVMKHYKLMFPGTLHRACDDAAALAMVLQYIHTGLTRSKL